MLFTTIQSVGSFQQVEGVRGARKRVHEFAGSQHEKCRVISWEWVLVVVFILSFEIYKIVSLGYANS